MSFLFRGLGSVFSRNRLKVVVSYFSLLSIIFSGVSQACTAILVGKKASADGALIIARSEDFTTNNWAKHMVVRPHKIIGKDTTWVMANGLQVTAPEESLRYSAVADWDAFTSKNQQGKSFEERGVNELNVAISATNSAQMNDRAKKADPPVALGIEEQIIPSLILPQAKTARDAVQLLGNYVEKYGASEANGIEIADPNEVWYMEIGSAHHWIAVKVPENYYAIIANGLRIHDVNLNDENNVMYSTDLLKFVREHKLLKEISLESFNFAVAFGVVGDSYNIDREWLAQKILSPSIKQKARAKQYPLFLKPDNKISIKDIAHVLRANYTGTSLENKAERPIGVDRSSESHIIAIHPNMPQPLQAVIWQTPTNVRYSPFIPIFNVLDQVPVFYDQGSDQFDRQSAWWSFRALGSLSGKGVLNGKYDSLVSQSIAEQESAMQGSHSMVLDMLKTMYSKDTDLAVKFAQDYSAGLMYDRLVDSQKMFSRIMTDMTRSTEKNYSSAEFNKIKAL